MENSFYNIENSSIEASMSKDRKGIFFAVVGIMTIIVAIAGATFAFFQATASNSGISGSSAYVATPLTLSVSLASSSATGSLIPQLSNAINTAAAAGCVDGNSNTICKVYTVTVTNKTTTKMDVTGTLTITAASMPNLKWALSTTSATAGFGTVNAYTATNLGKYSVAAGASKTIYVVIWIAETGSIQTDSGNFTGVVKFNGSTSGQSGGISSTITPS